MSLEIFQSQMDDQVKELDALQKEMRKLAESRQTLLEQQNETDLVKKEIDILEEGSKVYKLIGPGLVRQDLNETKQNIKKRLDFIVNESKKVELLLKDNEQKQLNIKQKMTKIQENYAKLMKEKAPVSK